MIGRSPTPRSRWRIGKKDSSTRWLRRQERDPYVHGAKKRGFASRAAYKLIEIDEKVGLLKAASTVIDLGAAPGGWSEVAKAADTTVVAVDKTEFTPPPGVLALVGDITEPNLKQRLIAALGKKADLVLCDAAPASSGHRVTDRIRAEELALAAADLATAVLADGGNLLLKLFGNPHERLARLIADSFAAKRRLKPAASRKESAENYLLAIGFCAASR